MQNAFTAKDVKNAASYGASPSAESFKLGGYSVKVWHDESAESPYEWDGMAPALWIWGRDNVQAYGQDVQDVWRYFSDWQISRQWRKIAAILDLDESSHDKEARDNAEYYGDSLSQARRELFKQSLQDSYSESWGYMCDYLENLRALYRLAGIYADTFATHGYSQGDSAQGLIVATPEWLDAMGLKGSAESELAEDCKGQSETFGAYLWGDVYGFTIEDFEGETLDSCGGFIGDNAERSGLYDAIAEGLNGAIATRAERKTRKLKSLIAARVPLINRPAILAAI